MAILLDYVDYRERICLKLRLYFLLDMQFPVVNKREFIFNQNARGRNMRPPWVATPMQGNFSRQLLCKAIPKECKVSSSMLGRRHVCKVSSHSIERFGRLSAETKIHIKIYIKTLKSQKSLISCQKLTKIEIIKAIMISDRCVKFLRILLNGFEDNRQKPKFT